MELADVGGIAQDADAAVPVAELRNLGVPLPESHRAAEQEASGLLLTALQNRRDQALAVQGPPEFGIKYVEALEKQTDGGYLATLADLADLRKMDHFALVIRGECKLLHSVNDDTMDGEKSASLLNLFAMAAALVDLGRDGWADR